MAAITPRFDLPAHFLDVGEQRAGFVLLAAFLVSFGFLRTSARLMRSPRVPWWPGSVTTSGGLHLHHLVWGTVLVLLSGFLAFVIPDSSPTTEILAGVFGAGAVLTLDEFALLIYLRDVYWAEEGRASFDAVVVATILGGLIVVGFAPFDLKHNSSSVETLAVAGGGDLLLAVLAILKGRHLLGMIGLFIPLSVDRRRVPSGVAALTLGSSFLQAGQPEAGAIAGAVGADREATAAPGRRDRRSSRTVRGRRSAAETRSAGRPRPSPRGVRG